MKCFVYLRVSGKAQVRGDGFRRQFIACREYAAAHGLQIVGIFKERGVSGTKELDDRPALSRLFAALEENGVKTLLIEKLDRLARDLMVSETIVKDIKTSGYTLLSTCEPDLCSNMSAEASYYVIFPWLARWKRPERVMPHLWKMAGIWLLGMIPGALYMVFNPDGIAHPDRWS